MRSLPISFAGGTLGLLAVTLVRGIVPPSEWRWAPMWVLLAAVGCVGLLGAFRYRRETADSPWKRDPGVFALVAALAPLLALFVFSPGPRLTADGVDHFVYLRSVWMDGDLDLENDFAIVAPRLSPRTTRTPIGREGNLHPVGPAVLWSPFYVAADPLSRLTGRPPDGRNLLFKNAAAVASLAYGWLGLVLLYRTCIRFASRAAALLASLGIGFGTFLYGYLTRDPTMSHAPAFGTVALFMWLWLRPATGGARRAALLGAASGLAALVKWSNGLVVLMPVIEALPRTVRRAEWPRLAKEGLVFGAAALVAFSPQLVVWKRLYGSFLTIPQGADFVAQTPAIEGVLFSPHHGLFSWSPILYLGVVGLILFLRHEPARGIAAIAFFAALTRLNAGVLTWAGSAAFGARRFDSVLPLLGLGMALAIDAGARVSRRRPLLLPGALVAALIAWNLGLAKNFYTPVWNASAPVSFQEMGHGFVSQIDRLLGSPFSLPASLAEWARSGRHPADYESLSMTRRHSRWTIRMGVDDRLFLEDGWSAPISLEGASCRLLAQRSAALVVPLHKARPSRFGARLTVTGREEEALPVRIIVNARVVGRWNVSGGWRDYWLDVESQSLHAGRNDIRLRQAARGERRLAVAGTWLEPRQERHSSASDPAGP